MGSSPRLSTVEETPQLIRFSRIFASLLRFRDGFDGSEKVRALSLEIPTYVGLLCANPEIFDSNYTRAHIINDFLPFIKSGRATPDWFRNFTQKCENPEATEVLLQCLFRICDEFLSPTLSFRSLRLACSDRTPASHPRAGGESDPGRLLPACLI
jgi:hypothetical protein